MTPSGSFGKNCLPLPCLRSRTRHCCIDLYTISGLEGYLAACEDKRWAAVGKSELRCIRGDPLSSPAPTSQLIHLGRHANKRAISSLQEVRQFSCTPSEILLLCRQSPCLSCQFDNLAFQRLNLCLQKMLDSDRLLVVFD